MDEVWEGGGGAVFDLNNAQLMLHREDVDLLSACYQSNEGASRVILPYSHAECCMLVGQLSEYL